MLNREHLSDALRFWEVGRLPYNLALALTVLAALSISGWLAPEAVPLLAPLAPAFIVLAALANVLYCAAYPIDLLLQAANFRDQRRTWRIALWIAGTALAAGLAWLVMLGATSLGGFD